jgi:hypothetical protein
MASEDTPQSRREFLKSASVGVGFGTIGLAPIKSRYKKVTIPITRSRHGDVVHTKEVPQKWWNQVNHAKKVLRKVGQQDKSGAVQLSLVNSDRKIGERHTFQIRKAVDPQKHHGRFTTTQKDGVLVETVQAEEAVPLGCRNNRRYNTVNGAVVVSDTTNGSTSYGSTGARVFFNGTPYMLTAAHIWNACGRSVINDVAHQPLPFNYFGNIAAVDEELDYILIESGSRNIGGRIKGAGPVRGRVTQEGLCDYQANNVQVEKVGVTTGKTYGRIWTCNTRANLDSTCISFGYPDYGGVGTTVSGAQGDSGSMVYWENDDTGKCFVVSLVSLGQFPAGKVSSCFAGVKSQKYDYNLGTSATYITRNTPYSFG